MFNQIKIVLACLLFFCLNACSKRKIVAPEKEEAAFNSEITRGLAPTPLKLNAFIYTVRAHDRNYSNNPTSSAERIYHTAYFSDLQTNLAQGYTALLYNQFQGLPLSDLSVGDLKVNNQTIQAIEQSGPRYFYTGNFTGSESEYSEINFSYTGNGSWPAANIKISKPFALVNVEDTFRLAAGETKTFKLRDIFSEYDSAFVYLYVGHYRGSPEVRMLTTFLSESQEATFSFDQLNYSGGYGVLGIYCIGIKYFYKWQDGKLIQFEFRTSVRVTPILKYP